MPYLSAELQTLLDRVAEGAALSCGADDAELWLLQDDELHRVAHSGPIRTVAEVLSVDVASDSNLATSVRERRTIQIDSDTAPQSHPALRA